MNNGKTSVWNEWKPSPDEPWDVRRVVHLHRRAAFAPTWSEVQRDLRDGPRQALSRLLDGTSRPQGVPKDYARMAQVINDSAVSSGNPNRLKASWLYRMMLGPDPLREKIALMWHNHFATSNLKVSDLATMQMQNEIFRQHGRARFDMLLGKVVRDPAMLIWLDADSNRKGRPNENLAREIMELFTLGIGNYTEQDVKQGARALTGWTIREGEFHENFKAHDDGNKTILGKTGRWRGDDFVGILTARTATARRLAWRICNTFLGEEVADAKAVNQLAQGLRNQKLDIGWAVTTVLRSRLFFSAKNIGSQVSDPVEFIVGAVRSLEYFEPPPSTLLLAEWATRLGQDLFYPPNVGGWSGGRDWLSSQTIVGRANYSAALVDGKLNTSGVRVDLDGLLKRHKIEATLTSAVTFFDGLLLGNRMSDKSKARVLNSLKDQPLKESERIRWAVALMLSLPEAQLT